MTLLDWFRPSWKQSDWRKRLAAVEGIDDERILLRIALSDDQSLIRGKAVQKLTSIPALDTVLDNISPHHVHFSGVRDHAESRKATLLAERTRGSVLEGKTPAELIRMLSRERVCRSGLLLKIDDQVALAAVARSSLDDDTRELATERLHEQSVLSDLAQHSSCERVRVAAVARTTDQVLLEQLAKGDVRSVAAAALTRIVSGPFHREVVLHSPHVEHRMISVSNIEDPEVLREVVLNDGSSDVRSHATQRVQDRDLLERVAFNDKERSVRDAAARRLGLNGTLCPNCDRYVASVHETTTIATFHEHWGAGQDEVTRECCCECRCELPRGRGPLTAPLR
jgi:hypothetical protein